MKKLLDESKPWIDETWEKITEKLRRNSYLLKNKIPSVTTDGVYDDKSEKGISWWTNGFWAGMLWLLYHATGNGLFKATAEISEQRLDAALDGFLNIDHDAGEYADDGGDYIRLLDWLEEAHLAFPIHIHSMNPVGVENMKRIIQRNNWKEI